MFENLQNVFEKVYKLARERKINYDKDKSLHSFCSSDPIEINQEKRKKAKAIGAPLKSYLDTLDFETIKVIQTIMYLGRDNEYPDTQNGEERYKRLRDNFDNGKGWVTKEIEIDQIVGKMPLDKYFKNGLEILKRK